MLESYRGKEECSYSENPKKFMVINNGHGKVLEQIPLLIYYEIYWVKCEIIKMSVITEHFF